MMRLRFRAPATVFSAGKHSRPRRERFAALSESGGGAKFFPILMKYYYDKHTERLTSSEFSGAPVAQRSA